MEENHPTLNSHLTAELLAFPTSTPPSPSPSPASTVVLSSRADNGAETTHGRQKHRRRRRRNASGRESEDETTVPWVDSENESSELEKSQCE